MSILSRLFPNRHSGNKPDVTVEHAPLIDVLQMAKRAIETHYTEGIASPDDERHLIALGYHAAVYAESASHDGLDIAAMGPDLAGLMVVAYNMGRSSNLPRTTVVIPSNLVA